MDTSEFRAWIRTWVARVATIRRTSNHENSSDSWLLPARSTVTAPLAVDREFSDIVRAISDEFRAQPTRIPLFGLVNAFTYVVRPAGTSHIDLAVFEKLNVRHHDGAELSDAIQRAVGRGWAPFVQVHSRRHGSDEVVLVYMRSEGRNCRLLVTSIEREEATVVQLKLNPEGLAALDYRPHGVRTLVPQEPRKLRRRVGAPPALL